MLFGGVVSLAIKAWGGGVALSALLNAWPAYKAAYRSAREDQDHLADCRRGVLNGLLYKRTCDEAEARLDQWVVQRWWTDVSGRIAWLGPLGYTPIEFIIGSWFAPFFSTCALMLLALWAAELWHRTRHN